MIITPLGTPDERSSGKEEKDFLKICRCQLGRYVVDQMAGHYCNAIAFPVLLLSYHWLVRRTWIGAWLKKTKLCDRMMAF